MLTTGRLLSTLTPHYKLYCFRPVLAAGWLADCAGWLLAGLLAGWPLAGWLSGWLAAGWLAGWLGPERMPRRAGCWLVAAGWRLAGLLAGWRAGWLAAGRLAGCWLAGVQSACRGFGIIDVDRVEPKNESRAGSMIMELARAAILKLNIVKICDPETWKRPVCLGCQNTRVFSRLRDRRFCPH